MKIIFLLISTAFLSGCSYVTDFFGTKEPSLLKGVLPTLPAGYCYLDAKNPNESKVLNRIQKQYGKKNGVRIQVYLPCATLEAIRKGTPDQKITQYGMIIELEPSEVATKKRKTGGDDDSSEADY